MCCSAGRFETLTLHGLAETFCSQIKIGILVEIGMQESMLLVSLYVTRIESYGGHFRSAMRAEVCQMCRLTGWDGAVFVASGASWVLLVLCLLWLKYDSKMSRKLQTRDWAGLACVCVVQYMLVTGQQYQTESIHQEKYQIL